MKSRGLKLVLFTAIIFSITNCKTQEEATPSKNGTTSREQFKSLFHEAMSEKMIGHYDRATTLFEQCLILEPQNAAVHFALADLYEVVGDLPKAIQEANAAYDLDKTNKWYGIKVAQLYFKAGDYEKSASFFSLTITEEEKSLELKYQYAEALINSKQYAKAIVVLDDIEVETGKFAEMSLAKHDMYMILGQPEKAKAEIDLLLSENPTNVDFRMTVGQYYLDTDQYDKARTICQEIIKINPEFGEVYFLLGDIELRSNNVQKAMDFYGTGFAKESVSIERKLYFIDLLMPMAFSYSGPESKIVEKGLGDAFKSIYDPALKNAQLHTKYGDYLMQSGNKNAALEQFKIVAGLNSADYSFWKLILELEMELEDYPNLFIDSQKALELFPSQPEFYLFAGIAGYEVGKFSESEEFLFLGKDLVVNNNPLRAEFYTQLGVMNCVQKKYSEGYSNFEEAKKIDPTEAKSYGLKAYYLLQENKIQEAETEVEKGLTINPNSTDVIYTKGLLLIAKKQFQNAVDFLKSAAPKNLENGKFLELYGDALFLNGQKEDAIIIWQEALKNGNQSELLKRKIADKTYYEN
ncbi:MAG: tetratricopeptide repeat protein [Crocinitomicaceae bacterium]|nr:tetratricopeptide repeat protein [Crocinitomicaceae bacterium]